MTDVIEVNTSPCPCPCPCPRIPTKRNRALMFCDNFRARARARAGVLFFLTLILSGCGYQFGGAGSLPQKYYTITVPYVEGDIDGALTAAIIRRISSNGAFEYRHSGGALLLQAKIIEIDDENVGFRYDRHRDGKIKQTIIPTETRLTEIVEVTVVDSGSGCAVLGPVWIRGSIDFDHDFYKSRNGINIFSLGQLTDYDSAEDAAMRPLNEVMAKKIADYICDSW